MSLPTEVPPNTFDPNKTTTMGVLIILLIASLGVAVSFLVAFLWGVKNKQFDDDFSPPRRILFDDAPAVHKSENTSIIN